MAIETLEGDFVIKVMGQDRFRLRLSEDSMMITVSSLGQTSFTVVCTINEAKELDGWLTRRLNEDIE